MNFFKSVFSDDVTPPDSPKSPNPALSQDSQPNLASAETTWSLGGLIKTLASKSESVIDTYRRDFQELGSGLRKETNVIREAASRAVMELPASFEVGASVAQESLETVGQAIDDIGATVWKSTAHIISQGRDSFLAPHDHNLLSDNSFSSPNNNNYNARKQPHLELLGYSRFHMQLRAIQCDLNTYCTEPEDKADYEKWRLEGFVLEDHKQEIESLLCTENGVIREIYDEVVPGKVDSEGFWSRYFYRVHKLKLAEEARALLVKRSTEEEDDLSWDIDDDDDENNDKEEVDGSSSLKGESSGNEPREKNIKIQNALETAIEKENIENFGEVDKSDNQLGTSEERVVVVAEGRRDNVESSRDSDVSVVSSQSLLPEEEDLGWDEIEDIGSDEESKYGVIGSTMDTSTEKVDLRKRLSSAGEEVDLSWDIEDEDEPVKP